MASNEAEVMQRSGENHRSEPVTLIWDGILLLSLNGILDSSRSQNVMDSMLSEIARTRSRVFILDILGVEAVDTAVANHLIKIVQASALLGCRCVISGISPSVAQALVQLGIPLSDIVTRATIRDALAHGFELLEVEVVEKA